MHGDSGLEAVDHAAEAVLPLALADPAVLQRAGEALLAACADGAAKVGRVDEWVGRAGPGCECWRKRRRWLAAQTGGAVKAGWALGLQRRSICNAEAGRDGGCSAGRSGTSLAAKRLATKLAAKRGAGPGLAAK